MKNSFCLTRWIFIFFNFVHQKYVRKLRHKYVSKLILILIFEQRESIKYIERKIFINFFGINF